MLTRLNVAELNDLHSHIVAHLKWPFDAGPERLRYLTLCLCGESGELANLVKKDWRGDVGSNERAVEIAKEIADVGNYIFMLAEALGIDLPQVMLAKLIEVEGRPTWKGGLPK